MAIKTSSKRDILSLYRKIVGEEKNMYEVEENLRVLCG